MVGDSIIYLDYAASTPCEESVVDAMLPFFTENWANASSLEHPFGEDAYTSVQKARKQAAKLINSSQQEITWTSSATESNNLAIQGIAKAYRKSNPNKIGHIITAQNEHKSVLTTCQMLQREGIEVTLVKPDSCGVIRASAIEASLQSNTFLVTIMWANNELGTINEIFQIGDLCKQKKIIFHSDGTQWIGKMPTNVRNQNIDLLSWSGHKIYGPKGVGALYIRSTTSLKIQPIIYGGDHENGLRSGSLNVPGIVGFGKACEICQEKMEFENNRLIKLRKLLENGLLNLFDGLTINGCNADRLPHISNITFPSKNPGFNILKELKYIACSSGAACGNNSLKPSHVLLSIGLTPKQAKNSLRISLGRNTSIADIDKLIAYISEITYRLN